MGQLTTNNNYSYVTTNYPLVITITKVSAIYISNQFLRRTSYCARYILLAEFRDNSKRLNTKKTIQNTRLSAARLKCKFSSIFGCYTKKEKKSDTKLHFVLHKRSSSLAN